jgi:hypothetical protein
MAFTLRYFLFNLSGLLCAQQNRPLGFKLLPHTPKTRHAKAFRRVGGRGEVVEAAMLMRLLLLLLLLLVGVAMADDPDDGQKPSCGATNKREKKGHLDHTSAAKELYVKFHGAKDEAGPVERLIRQKWRRLKSSRHCVRHFRRCISRSQRPVRSSCGLPRTRAVQFHDGILGQFKVMHTQPDPPLVGSCHT